MVTDRDSRHRGYSAPKRLHGLSPLLLDWLGQLELQARAVVDVGTGTGRLALLLAQRARRVVGIDTDAGALVEARRRARRAGIGNVLFVVADAERADYRALGLPGLVTANLCISDAIVARAAAGLDPGGLLAFAAFHVDQWRETGHVSRFAYAEERARRVVEAAGFRIERLEVEREVTRFMSAEEAREKTTGLRAKWERDGRWAAWQRFLGEGGRMLTESRIVVLAHRIP